MEAKGRIIVALDMDSVEDAAAIVQALGTHMAGFKIGPQLLSVVPSDSYAISMIRDAGGRVFIDRKLHDIPSIVGKAVRNLVRQGADMLTVHASGGGDMVRAAVENAGDAMVLVVTVLTSLDEAAVHQVYNCGTANRVLAFASMAHQAGAAGIICSAADLQTLSPYRELAGLCRVTPGIRPTWAAAGDQGRVFTPADAVLAGADYLVIGRPILQPPAKIGTPRDAFRAILSEIERAAEPVLED